MTPTAAAAPRRLNRHQVSVLLSLGCCLALSASASGATVESFELDNGVRVASLIDENTPLITLNLWIEGGRANDPPGQEGLADLTSQLRGRAINRDLAAGLIGRPYMAGRLSTSTAVDRTRYQLKVLPHHLRSGLEVLRRILPQADDPLPEVSSLKTTAIGGILRSRREDPIAAQYAFLDATCGVDCPQGATASVRSLFGLTRDDVHAYFASRYVAGACVVSAAGDMDRDELSATAAKTFGDLPAKAAPARATTPRAAGAVQPGVLLVDNPNTDRATIIGGLAAPGKESADFQYLSFLHVVLGSGAAEAAIAAAAAGGPYQFLAGLVPSGASSLLSLRAVAPHGRAVEVLRVMRSALSARQIALIDDTVLEGLMAAHRAVVLNDDSDPALALSRQLPFLLAGRPVGDSELLADLDLGAWRTATRTLVDPDAQAWVIVGRAIEIAEALTDAGIDFRTTDVETAVLGGALASLEGEDFWQEGSAPPARVLRGEQLLVRALEARGGFEALESKLTYDARYKRYRPMDAFGTVISERRVRTSLPDRLRQDTTMSLPMQEQDIQLVQVYNNGATWRSQLDVERPADGRDAENTELIHWLDPIRVLLRYGKNGTRLRAIESEALGSTTLPGFELRQNRWLWTRIYLHPESFQIVKQVHSIQGKENMVEVNRINTNYQEFAGIFLPTVSAVFENDDYAGEEHLESILFDVDLDNLLFERTQF